jgi:hypothetical protein
MNLPTLFLNIFVNIYFLIYLCILYSQIKILNSKIINAAVYIV